MNPDRINQYRAYVTWSIRVIAIILICYGGYWCVNRTLFGILSGQSFVTAVFQTWMQIGEGNAMYHGMTSLLLGALLAASSQRIAVWIIALPSDSCPGCGYLRPLGAGVSTADSSLPHSSRCPECGLEGYLPTSTDTKADDREVD